MTLPKAWCSVPLAATVGRTGLITDGDWIIAENMDPTGKVRLIQLADVGIGEFLDRSSKFITHEKFEELKCTQLEAGDVLISRMADPIGRACIVPQLNQSAITAVDVTILRTDRQIADPRYVMYLCNIRFFRDQTTSVATGTTRSRITRRNLEKIEIPLPPLSEQRRIVEILDQADALRKKRAKADAKAERILPALFCKMFGDPVTNPKGWDQVPLKKLLRDKKGALQSGPFGSNLHNSDFVDEGTIFVVGIDNVHDSGFQIGRNRRITLEKYQELKKYKLEPGDVLITIMGTVGRTCVFPDWVGEAVCTKHVYRIQTERNRLDPEYLCASIRFSPAIRAQLGSSITGQIVDAVTSEDLRGLLVDVPPIDLQKQFARLKESLDREASRRRDSSLELDRLFDVLLHRAFSGDLTARWRGAHMKELLAEMEEQAKYLTVQSANNHKETVALQGSLFGGETSR